MLPFVILPFCLGPLSFEYTVVRLFMYQRLIGLLILLLGDPSILVEDLLHFYILTGAPCPMIIQKAMYVPSFQFDFLSSS